MIGVSNPKIYKYLTKSEAENEYVPKTEYDPSDISGILSSIQTLNNEVISINSDISTINTNLQTTNSNVSTNTTNIQNNSNDIDNLSSEVNTLTSETSTNTTNISTNTNDISDLKTRMTTAEGTLTSVESNITTNTNDISSLQSQISALSVGSAFEGYYYSIYSDAGSSRAKIRYNYNIGDMMFWHNSSRWQAVINDTYLGPLINQNIKGITLPSRIKRIAEDGSVAQHLDTLTYLIEAPSESGNRMTMNNLKTLTTEPDIKRLEINLTAAPNLSYFNLLEGLQILKLSYSSFSPNHNKISLTIPSSVVECELKSLTISNLIIDDGPQDLKLTYTANLITNKFICNRTLTNTSSFSMWKIQKH